MVGKSIYLVIKSWTILGKKVDNLAKELYIKNIDRDK